MGGAPQRDFLLASPAAADQDAATISIDQLLNLSRKATGSNHPSVWSLGPAEDHPKSLPAAFHQDDGDLWLLEFRLPLQEGTARPSPSSMAPALIGPPPAA